MNNMKTMQTARHGNYEHRFKRGLVLPPHRQKFEALLSCMQGIISDESVFPCLPWVAYGLMRKMVFLKYDQENGQVFTQPWAIPVFNGEDFFIVPQHFVEAALYFLGEFPECRQDVQSLQESMPSLQSLQQWMVPDRRTAFLNSFRNWLQVGRSSLDYTTLESWDRIHMCTPFWKDEEFCRQEFEFVEENVAAVPCSNTQHHKYLCGLVGLFYHSHLQANNG